MSIDRLINGVKGHAAAMDGQSGQTRVGVVSAYDPARGLARVTLQPEGVTTGWLPVTSAWVGPGWGLASPLMPGVDQVLCQPQEGDADSLHIIGRIFSTGALPPTAPSAPSGNFDQNGNAPTNAQAGELLLVSQAGAVFRLCADGSIYTKGPINADGDALVNGNVQTTRNVEVGSGASGSFTTPTGQIVTVKDGIIINIF